MTDSRGPDCAELLAQADWVRSLARHLTADAHAAEDLAQDALAAALARPVLDQRPLRVWLAGVLRNLVRQERRREGHRGERERAAARGEAEASTAELLERLDSHRAVVDAVARLDEQYRNAVLLRYFEGLSPAAIARRTGTPIRTVHTRLQRALARLRADLDRAHGGDRRAWLLALIPYARGSEGGTAAAIWTLLMEAKMKLGLAAAAVVGICSTLVLWRNAGTASAPLADEPQGVALSAPRSQAPEGALEDVPAAAERQALEVAREEPAAEVAPEAAPKLAGRVIDAEHAPVAGIRVRFVGQDAAAQGSLEAVTDVAGAFAIDPPDGPGTLDVATAGWTSLFRPELCEGRGARELVLVVARSLTLAGVVVDEQGAGIEAARVCVPLPFSLRTRFDAILDGSATVEPETTTGPSGGFELKRVPAVAGVDLVTTRPAFLDDRRAVPERDELALEIVLRQAHKGPERLVGLVVDPAGDPVEGAWVGTGGDATRSGPEGAFALELGGQMDPPGGPLVLRAVKIGYLPAELQRASGAAWPDPLVLELGPPPLSITGRVLDASGEGLPGAEVWTDEETGFGYIPVGGGEMSMTMGASLEGILRGDPWTFRVQADAAGRFELVGLLPRDYRVRAFDRTRLALATAILTAGAKGVELRMSEEELLPRVGGRVTSLAGTPLSGVQVMLERAALGSGPANLLGSRMARTDDDGYFAFERVSRAVSALQLHGPELGVTGHRHALRAEDDPERLEIAVPLRAYVQVDAGEAAGVERVSLLDAQGQKLDLTLEHGEHAYVMDEIALEAGRSESFSVCELATTLVLYAKGEEVRRVSVELVPGELNTIRP